MSLEPLAPCPDRPNCVCSQDPDPRRRVAPLSFSGDPGAAWSRLKEALRALPRVEVVFEEPGRLRAVATTAVLRFKDDMEFLLAPEERVIHVRSTSRVGYSDLGVNRRRIENIRTLFEKIGAGR